MRGRESAVREALRDLDEIRRSRSDPDVYLFYRADPPYRIAVVKQAESGGFIVTTYRTENIKEGEQIWQRSK